MVQQFGGGRHEPRTTELVHPPLTMESTSSGTVPPDKDKHHHHQHHHAHHQQHAQSGSGHHHHHSASAGGSVPVPTTIEKLCRPAAFDKMENLVREMQDGECGVPVRSQKLFLTSIPSAFMGYDLIEWLMERLGIEESEALNIANHLCLHGYFFPVNDSKNLVVKDDSSLYRFQTPYFWPWQHKAPDNIEYAIYLTKRSLRNKQRHGLEEYETEAMASLHKNLKGKWDFITMQAEEQVRLSKERKKGDKIVGDSQERAYWRVYRPPPGQFTPLEPCPVPSRDRKIRKRTLEDHQREVEYLKTSLTMTRMKMSQACELLIQYYEVFAEYDPLMQPALPSNPWVSEDTTFWQLNNTLVDLPTEKRVKRWSISIEELVSDPTGLLEFTNYLKKEYSHENIRFWTAVNDLRRSAHSQIAKKVTDIYEEFLEPGAPCEINIDSKTMEKVQVGLKTPSRFTFDAAADHIYTLLLKKDCYPRFIRSEHYKMLLASGIQPSQKKRFFGFGGAAKKKASTATPPNATHLPTGGGSSSANPGSLGRRRGSDRSLTGSAHELAVSGVKDASKVPHSHSQSNLCDIPYRGDMPSSGMVIPEKSEVQVVASSSSAKPGGPTKIAKIQETTPKSYGDNLEATIEGACSVCPWDTATTPNTAVQPTVESSVSVSICPWDEDTKPVANSSKIPIYLEKASDIGEVSERMKRSCGLRQSTLDSDFHSSKNLMPDVTTQRRASITITPRISEYHTVTSQKPVHGSSMTGVFMLPETGAGDGQQNIASTSQLSLSMDSSASIDDRELAAVRAGGSSSFDPSHRQSTSGQGSSSVDEATSRPPSSAAAVEQTTTIAPSITMLVTSDESANDYEPIAETLIVVDEVEPSSVTMMGDCCGEKTIQNTLNNSSSSVINNNNSTNIIIINNDNDDNVDDNRKNDEENDKDGNDDDKNVAVLYENDNITNDNNNNITLSSSDLSNSRVDPVINVVSEATSNEQQQQQLQQQQCQESCLQRTSPVAITVEQIHEGTFSSKGGHQLCRDNSFEDDETLTSEKTPSEQAKASCSKDAASEKESSKLCPKRQSTDLQSCEDFDYEELVEDGNRSLLPGCVAPAPTPAPSIAPLAEVEQDPQDSEFDDDEEEEDFGRREKGISEKIICDKLQQQLMEPSSGGLEKQLSNESEMSRTESLPTPPQITSTLADSTKKDLVEPIPVYPTSGQPAEAAPATAGQTATTTKKRRKKRSSDVKAASEESKEDQLSAADAKAEGNPVCPWEDEDSSTSVQVPPFVKTYATLGYL